MARLDKIGIDDFEIFEHGLCQLMLVANVLQKVIVVDCVGIGDFQMGHRLGYGETDTVPRRPVQCFVPTRQSETNWMKWMQISAGCEFFQLQIPQILAVIAMAERRMPMPQSLQYLANIFLLHDKRARRQCIPFAFIAAHGTQNRPINRDIDRCALHKISRIHTTIIVRTQVTRAWAWGQLLIRYLHAIAWFTHIHIDAPRVDLECGHRPNHFAFGTHSFLRIWRRARACNCDGLENWFRLIHFKHKYKCIEWQSWCTPFDFSTFIPRIKATKIACWRLRNDSSASVLTSIVINFCSHTNRLTSWPRHNRIYEYEEED